MSALKKIVIIVVVLLVCGTAFAQVVLDKKASPVYSIVAGGDVMLGRKTATNIQKYGAHYPWKYVAPTFAAADIAFVNLEGVASWKGKPLDKRYVFRFAPESLNGLVSAGIDVVSIANNHTLDYGYAGLCDSYNSITSRGVAAVGAGCTRAQAISPNIQKLPDGTRVAFFAISEFYQGNTATKTRPGYAPFSIAWITDQAISLKESNKADIVVVSVHAGTEHVFVPNQKMKDMYRTLIDGGVDIVLGHHPHVPQPIEKYNDGYIAYSLGNLIFDMHHVIPTTKRQILARFNVRDGVIIGAQRILLEMNDDFQPYRVSDKDKIQQGLWVD